MEVGLKVKFRQGSILKRGLQEFVCILVCLMMVFLLNMFGGVACAAGELNLKLRKIEDVKGWFDCELANIDMIETINIEVLDSVRICENSICRMSPESDCIFDFSGPRFKGKTININGNGKTIVNECGVCLLSIKDCTLNLNDVVMDGKDVEGETAVEAIRSADDRVCVLNLNGSSKIKKFRCARKDEMIDTANCSLITGHGGAILCDGATINMNARSSIVGCWADYGGAIYVIDGALNMNARSSIAGCWADSGGAVYASGAAINMNGNSRISECRATFQGGGIYAVGSTVNMDKSANISGCEASDGGAIKGSDELDGHRAIKQSNGARTQCKLNKKRPTRPRCQGIVKMNGKSKICGCRATCQGGAMSVYYVKVVIDEGSVISGCVVDGDGGAIYGWKSEIELAGQSKIKKCTAKFGGAVRCRSGSDAIVFRGGLIEDCSVTFDGKGDAIYFDFYEAPLKIADSETDSFKITLANGHGYGKCFHNAGVFCEYDGVYCEQINFVEYLPTYALIFEVVADDVTLSKKTVLACEGGEVDVAKIIENGFINLKHGDLEVEVRDGKVKLDEKMMKKADENSMIFLKVYVDPAKVDSCGCVVF